MTWSAALSTPSRRVSMETPFQLVPSFDHFVTQWMSTVTSSAGRAVNSSQLQPRGLSTWPRISKRHSSRPMRGVGPADRTGKSRVMYWPGGTRSLGASASSRRRNPREMKVIGAASAEGKAIRLDAGFEELDLADALGDRALLPNQLVEALLVHCTASRIVDVHAMRGTGRLAVEAHAHLHRAPAHGRPHHEVHVPGMEPNGDAPVGVIQHRGMLGDRPVPDRHPLVEPEPQGLRIRVGLIEPH